MATKAQASMSVVFGVGAAVCAGVVAHSAIASNAVQYTAVVTAAAVTPLDFQSSGYIANISVHPGQFVRHGTVLATQSSAAAAAHLQAAQAALTEDGAIESADQAAVPADQARVNALANPQSLPPAVVRRNNLLVAKAEVQMQQAEAGRGGVSQIQAAAAVAHDNIVVAKAQQALQKAQQAQQSSSAVESQNVTRATNVLHLQQAQLASESSKLSQAPCNLNLVPSYATTQCEAVLAQVQREQQAVTDQEGLLNVLQAESARSASEANAAVSLAQTNLQLAQTDLQGAVSRQAAAVNAAASQASAAIALAQLNLQLAQNAASTQVTPPNPAQVYEAQGSLAHDQAQVARDQAAVSRDIAEVQSARLALSEMQIVAPADAVVLAVNGEVGALADSAGIHSYGNAQGVQQSVQTSPLFSLLPPPAQSSGSSTPNGSLPVIEVRAASTWQVVAQASETQLHEFTRGRTATVSIPAANLTVRGTVGPMLGLPIETGGAAHYQIQFEMAGDLPANVMPGMTADVKLS